MADKFDLREEQMKAYLELVDEGCNLVYVISDSESTSKITPFKKKYPDRLINVGIAEQNLIGVATGLSKTGFVVATGNATSFLVSRSNEQIKVDISYSHSNVKLNGMHSGFGYAKDGVTHHEVNDISTFRGFPAFQIFCPCDAREVKQLVRYAVAHDGPVYISYATGSFPLITPDSYTFIPGIPLQVQKGEQVTILCLGTAIFDAVLADCKNADVFMISSIRPLCLDEILESINKTKKVITVEQHSTHGGLGSIIAEAIADNGLGAKLIRLGVTEGEFTLNQSIDINKAKFKIDADGIKETYKKLVNNEN